MEEVDRKVADALEVDQALREIEATTNRAEVQAQAIRNAGAWRFVEWFRR